MTQKRKKRNHANSPQAKLLITLAVLLVAVTAGLLSRNKQQESAAAAAQVSPSADETHSAGETFPIEEMLPIGEMPPTEVTPSQKAQQTDGILEVHFLDVGQGDSILIRCGREAMLIDAGTGESARDVTEYIDALGISSIKYVIATHPHEDHIGGMAECIRTFNIDTFIMPDIEHTTQTYEGMLDALIDRNVKVIKPLTGGQFNLGDASFTVLGPTSDYDGNLNNMSVGIKLTYGNTSFVMCGDAEEEAEAAMCQNGIDLSADVLKLGHHGSSTSSCEALDRKSVV